MPYAKLLTYKRCQPSFRSCKGDFPLGHVHVTHREGKVLPAQSPPIGILYLGALQGLVL